MRIRIKKVPCCNLGKASQAQWVMLVTSIVALGGKVSDLLKTVIEILFAN